MGFENGGWRTKTKKSVPFKIKLFPKQTKFPGQPLHTVIGYPIPFLCMCCVTRDSWCRNSRLHRMRNSNCFILCMTLVKTSLSRNLVQPPPPPAQPCSSKPSLQRYSHCGHVILLQPIADSHPHSHPGHALGWEAGIKQGWNNDKTWDIASSTWAGVGPTSRSVITEFRKETHQLPTYMLKRPAQIHKYHQCTKNNSIKKQLYNEIYQLYNEIYQKRKNKSLQRKD